MNKFYPVRWSINEDIPVILEIEQLSFNHGWTQKDFLYLNNRRDYLGWVAEDEEKVVGFMVIEFHKKSFRIVNFAVHPAWRRVGVGTSMVNKLVSKLRIEGRTRIALEIRETNLAGQLFFQKQGFRGVQVLPNFYEENPEDAFLMEYHLPGCLDEQALGTTNRLAQFMDD